MRFLILGLVLTLISYTGTSQNNDTQKDETTTYYLIRHAEKDRSNSEDRNPDLNDEGKRRAQEWVDILEDKHITMIYSTNYKRTRNTAQPIADALDITVQTYNPRALYDESFKKATKGKTVLIVGHSNTTPMFVNTIIQEKKYDYLDDKNNGALFKVTVFSSGNTAVEINQFEDGF